MPERSSISWACLQGTSVPPSSLFIITLVCTGAWVVCVPACLPACVGLRDEAGVAHFPRNPQALQSRAHRWHSDTISDRCGHSPESHLTASFLTASQLSGLSPYRFNPPGDGYLHMPVPSHLARPRCTQQITRLLRSPWGGWSRGSGRDCSHSFVSASEAQERANALEILQVNAIQQPWNLIPTL